MPALIAKYWRAKALTLALSAASVMGLWAGLAWPDWKAHQTHASNEEIAAALQYLAATSAYEDTSAALAETAPAAPPADVHQVVVVTRKAPREQIVVVTDGATGEDLPPIALPTAVPVAAEPAPARPARPSSPPPAPAAPPPPAPAPAPKPAPAPRPAPAPAPAPSKAS